MGKKQKSPSDMLARVMAQIVNAGDGGISAVSISARTRISAEDVNAAVASLRIRGRIVQREGRVYRGKPSVLWAVNKRHAVISKRILGVLSRAEYLATEAVICNRIPSETPEAISGCLNDLCLTGKVRSVMPGRLQKAGTHQSRNRTWVYMVEKGA